LSGFYFCKRLLIVVFLRTELNYV